MIIMTLKLNTLVTKRKSKTHSTPKAEPEMNPESIYLICQCSLLAKHIVCWQRGLCGSVLRN